MDRGFQGRAAGLTHAQAVRMRCPVDRMPLSKCIARRTNFEVSRPADRESELTTLTAKRNVGACDQHRTEGGYWLGRSISSFNSSPGWVRPRKLSVSGISLLRDKLSEQTNAADTLMLFMTIRQLLGRLEQHETKPLCRARIDRDPT